MRGGLERACAVVASLLLALPAHAADGGNDEAAATRSFREGRELLRQGRIAEGCEKMRESLALKRSPGILLNVAGCARDQGDLLGALAGFQAARDEAHAYPDAERGRLWANAADDALKQLTPRLAELELVQPSGAPPPPSWNVRVDGQRLVLRDGRAAQNPGLHQLEISADGQQPWSRELRLAEGERAKVEVELEPLVATHPAAVALPAEAAPAAPPVEMSASPPPRDESGSALLPTVLAIGGGALTVAGLSFGVVTWQRKNDLEGRCPGTDCPEGELDDAERLARVADVLVVSGVVLGVAGGAWLLWGQSSEPSAQLAAWCSSTTSCRASVRLTF